MQRLIFEEEHEMFRDSERWEIGRVQRMNPIAGFSQRYIKRYRPKLYT